MNKKIIIISAVSVLVIGILGYLGYFVATNMPKNTISCKSSSDSNGIKIEQNYSIAHNDDKVTNVEINKKFEYADAAQFKGFKDVVIPGTQSNMKAIEGTSIKFSDSTGTNSYSTKTTVDVQKASKENLENLNLDKSLKTLKTTLEEQGLTCSK